MWAYILPSILEEPEILLLHIYSAPFCLWHCLWFGYGTRIEHKFYTTCTYKIPATQISAGNLKICVKICYTTTINKENKMHNYSYTLHAYFICLYVCLFQRNVGSQFFFFLSPSLPPFPSSTGATPHHELCLYYYCPPLVSILRLPPPISYTHFLQNFFLHHWSFLPLPHSSFIPQFLTQRYLRWYTVI
jgi:hypothetical protein